MIRKNLISGFVMLALGCKDAPVYAPVGYNPNKTNELEQSIELNKTRNKEERIFIEKWIKQHPEQKFYSTPMGYWTDIEIDKREINTSENHSYEMEFYDFNHTKIYEKTIIRKNVNPIKMEEIKALQDIIKYLKINEKATLLVPSSLAYGMSGDGEKIPENLPIIIKLTKKD